MNSNSYEDNYILVVKILGAVTIFFFGAAGIFGSTKLLSIQVGLVIDSSGITDHSNASSAGLIEWSDIIEITTKQVMSTKFILIQISDPEKYIGKATSGFTAL